MRSIINTEKWRVAQNHALKYMKEHNIPLLPDTEMKSKKDGFISSYGPKDGVQYAVIKADPFPKDASADVKLIVSQIWEENNKAEISRKNKEFHRSMFSILSPCLQQEEKPLRQNSDIYAF